ncbi:MAG: hypothetical protein ABL886_14160, partial [Rhodoglobus sp.]
EFKREAVKELKRFYISELLPRARAELTRRGDAEGLQALEQEAEPLILLGGDEITVSLHPLFDDLGLTTEIATKLNEATTANARVAITRTPAGTDARQGHMDAMAAAQSGHDLLKDLEGLARRVEAHAKKYTPPDRTGQAFAADLQSMYASESTGTMVVRDRSGKAVDVDELRNRATAYLEGEPQGARKP